ncbi:hypothetical protein BDZ94DRAFT_1246842 [Collybia nuda]|uniref:Uncharacterized protein n=1 Tax=Collybia nuda TaxID=64659 RepID=A0A9P5YII0_9AGAR|nr:hypothetical protein BDZ94DRAFT_1246842 [Collybia nuda]
MPRPRDGPKYWNETIKRTVGGVKTRSIPTQLCDILGTYVWVYSGDPEFGGDVEHMYRGKGSDDATFIGNHSITLDTVRHQPGKALAPKSVSGCINWGSLKLAYDGLRCVRKGWSTDESVGWMGSCWEVLLVGEGYVSNGDQWLDPDGNAIRIAAEEDDNGNPFLVFDWSHPQWGHSSWSGYYLGKKIVQGKNWRLTGEEQSRLGMGYAFGKIEKLVTGEREKEYMEDEDEDDSDGDSSSGGGDSDKEDTGSGDEEDEDGEEALSDIKAAGGKRKVREGDTGANKRRRT